MGNVFSIFGSGDSIPDIPLDLDFNYFYLYLLKKKKKKKNFFFFFFFTYLFHIKLFIINYLYYNMNI